MFTPHHHRLFKKDIDRDKKSGKYSTDDYKLLKEVMTSLLQKEQLHEKHKNHPLKGEWEGTHECHVKNDWLLVYQISQDNTTLTFIRLGTHSQIFKKFK